MKTYLINLDRSTDRLKAMNKRLAEIGIAAERVPGIEGTSLNLDTFEINVPNPNYPRQLTPGEIGCFLSHRKCWEMLMQSEDDWALILEDDCIFYPSASRYLVSLDWLPNGCQLVHFYFTKRGLAYSDKQIYLPDNNCLFRVKVPMSVGAYAYCISKKSARIALELSQTIDRPVDNFLFGTFSPFHARVDTWRLQGAVLEPCQTVASTISGRGLKVFSWYRFHPFHLFNKIKLKLICLFLRPIRHYLIKN